MSKRAGRYPYYLPALLQHSSGSGMAIPGPEKAVGGLKPEGGKTCALTVIRPR